MRRRRPNLSLLLPSSPSPPPFRPLPPKSPVSPPPPLSSLLPPSLNPTHIAVDLICAAIRESTHQHQHQHQPNDVLHLPLQPHLLHHLRAADVSRILLRSQSHPLPSLSFLLWAKTHLPSHALTPQAYCLVAHVLAWSRHFSSSSLVLSDLLTTFPSENLFDHLRAASTAGCNWTPAIFGLALKLLVKMGDPENALKAFQKMIAIGLSPKTNDCNCLLNGLLKSNRMASCWKVYEEMKTAGISPNTYTFNIMTHVLCRSRAGDAAAKGKRFMEQMEAEGFEPDLVTYNTLIAGYCRKGQLEDAFYLYKIMYRRRVVPDGISYTLLMNGLCRKGNTTEAHRLFRRMVHDRGVEPDAFMYNALVVGYSGEGKMVKAKAVLEDMIQAGFLPDRLSCYALVEGMIRAGMLLPCLKVIARLRKMTTTATTTVSSKMMVSLECYRNMVGALCKDGRPHAGRKVMNWALEDGHSPDLRLYNILLSGYCDGGHVDEALELKDEMVGKGIRPDIASYRFLVGCLVGTGRTADGELLMWEEMDEDVYDPEICFFLISGYCKERDYRKAESLLAEVSEKKKKKKNVSLRDTIVRFYNVLIDAYCKEGEVSKSFQLQDRMLKLGIFPNASTCKSLIFGIISQTKLKFQENLASSTTCRYHVDR